MENQFIIVDGLYESTKTDNSHPGCYGYFRVEKQKITGIGEERTRDGGWYWLEGMPNLDKNIETLKDEFPKLYELALKIYQNTKAS